MNFVGWGLLALGTIISLGALVSEIKRIRVLDNPYSAMRRVPPEIHVVAALMTGSGTLILWTWPIALAVLVAHAVVGLAAALKIGG